MTQRAGRRVSDVAREVPTSGPRLLQLREVSHRHVSWWVGGLVGGWVGGWVGGGRVTGACGEWGWGGERYPRARVWRAVRRGRIAATAAPPEGPMPLELRNKEQRLIKEGEMVESRARPRCVWRVRVCVCARVCVGSTPRPLNNNNNNNNNN